MLTGSNIWQLTQCNSFLAENPRNDCFISFGRGLFPQPALASPWRGDNSRSGSLPRRRIQSGLRLLDTDCRIKDGWGREVTADCGGTLCSLHQELFTYQYVPVQQQLVFLEISLIPMPLQDLLHAQSDNLL